MDPHREPRGLSGRTRPLWPRLSAPNLLSQSPPRRAPGDTPLTPNTHHSTYQHKTPPRRGFVLMQRPSSFMTLQMNTKRPKLTISALAASHPLKQTPAKATQEQKKPHQVNATRIATDAGTSLAYRARAQKNSRHKAAPQQTTREDLSHNPGT